MMREDVTIAILAGGQSRRMGQEKAFVKMGERPFIDHILHQTQMLGCKQQIITNKPFAFTWLGVPLFADVWEREGALGGLCTALTRSPTPYTMVLACDMPLVETAVWHGLLQQREQAEAVIPCWKGQFQPFHAIYHHSCLSSLVQALADGVRSVKQALTRCHVHWVLDEEIKAWGGNGRCFANFNTPQDIDW